MTGPYRDPPRQRDPHAYLCRGCARGVARTTRHCPDCGAGVATVRCAACFHMNVPEDALCAGCGEPLGLEPVGEPSTLACPRCQRPFARFRGAHGWLFDCDRCGGQFVEHELLRDLLEQHDVYGSAAPRRPKRFTLRDEPVVYVACPVCGEPMNRSNFGRSSGVIIDACSAHGVWFDPGELPHVLAFVESGGLAEARRREQEERERAKLEQNTRDVENTLSGLSAPVHGEPDVAAGLALLSFVTDLLTSR